MSIKHPTLQCRKSLILKGMGQLTLNTTATTDQILFRLRYEHHSTYNKGGSTEVNIN